MKTIKGRAWKKAAEIHMLVLTHGILFIFFQLLFTLLLFYISFGCTAW